MHETLRHPTHSSDMEKHDNDVAQLEKVTTQTPPSEVEKGHTPQLAATASNGPVVHEKVCALNTLSDSTLTARQMNGRLFMILTCMSFLWVGSQIPLYLFGSVLPLIYQDIGGVDRWVWFVIAYLIPNAALCPFVGALSDLFGRQKVAIVGQICLIVGPIITATANTMNIAIGTNSMHRCITIS